MNSYAGSSRFFSDGKPLRSIGTVLDVTEKRLCYLALKEDKEYLEKLPELEKAIAEAKAKLRKVKKTPGKG